MKQYKLYDAYTKQEILCSEPFNSAFRPNRAVIMMMTTLLPLDFGKVATSQGSFKALPKIPDELIYR